MLMAWVVALALAGQDDLEQALQRIKASSMRMTVDYLSADALAGRCAGEPTNERAADFLGRRLSAFGLDPVGDGGSFFQEFTFGVRGGGGRKATARNVLGLWEGSDPQLKDEIVVIGAHMDHVGTVASFDAGRIGTVVGEDDIWNGADDNASGTATVLAIAEAFCRGGLRPRRSILFMFFNAEEHGLLGSAHYCREPIIPLEKTYAMLNMDMVGRNPELPLSVMGIGSARFGVWNRWIQIAQAAAPALELKLVDYAQADSDHDSFLSVGVPAAFMFSGLHEDYHRVTDHASLLDEERMAQVGRFSAALLWKAANSDEPLEFQKPVFEGRKRRTLEINTAGALTAAEMEERGLSRNQGGFRVTQVREGSVAAVAGLRVDDVILSVRGRALSVDQPAVSLRRLVAASPRNQEVEIGIWRDGEEKTLRAVWK